MISRSSVVSKAGVIEPFLLQPVGKDYLWGGERLRTDFGKKLDVYPLAETWECSTHAEGICRVVSGRFRGVGLDKVLEQFPEIAGTNCLNKQGKAVLPILVKLIDAQQNLSVQVHPSDEYAFERENGQLGKTEMWYVLDAVPGAKLIYGFSRDMTREFARRCIEQGTIEKYLNHVPIRKDDVFFIPSGQVHALCAGALVAEVQQSSNLTYRLYDYDRRGKDGEKRELHIEKALDVMNVKAVKTLRQPIRIKRFHPGYATELLCRCSYFQVERFLLNVGDNSNVPPAKVSLLTTSFQVLLCTDGAGVLSWEGAEDARKRGRLSFKRGDCIFLLAASDDLAAVYLSGKAQLLKVNS